MKVWPLGRRRTSDTGAPAGSRTRGDVPSADLARWVLTDESLLIESEFGGSIERYLAWRDRPAADAGGGGRTRADRPDEQYIVAFAFDGDWERYRACRDRLRDVLWQIMRVRDRR